LLHGDRDLATVLPVLEQTGALDETRAVAASYGNAARAALDGLPEGDWRDALATIVEGVLAQV
jgi:geranylgeranyl pyrophosphate synthase